MNGAISNQRKSGTEIEVATVMITRVRMGLFLTFSWKGFMHVCIVNMYCVYCMYGAIRRSQQDWDLSGEQGEPLCVVKSQGIHDQLRKTSPQKKCQKNILYYNLWRNVFLNYFKWGHPFWQYLCNQSKDFQYNNHQSECFLEWIDEESQIYPTLSFLFTSYFMHFRGSGFVSRRSFCCWPLSLLYSLTMLWTLFCP